MSDNPAPRRLPTTIANLALGAAAGDACARTGLTATTDGVGDTGFDHPHL